MNVLHKLTVNKLEYQYIRPCTILIGRDSKHCDIRIPDNNRISRIHAFFTIMADGKVYFGDGNPLGTTHSKNGFFLNGVHYVVGKSEKLIVELRGGESILIGDVEIKYQRKEFKNLTGGNRETLGFEELNS